MTWILSYYFIGSTPGSTTKNALDDSDALRHLPVRLRPKGHSRGLLHKSSQTSGWSHHPRRAHAHPAGDDARDDVSRRIEARPWNAFLSRRSWQVSILDVSGAYTARYSVARQ